MAWALHHIRASATLLRMIPYTAQLLVSDTWLENQSSRGSYTRLVIRVGIFFPHMRENIYGNYWLMRNYYFCPDHIHVDNASCLTWYLYMVILSVLCDVGQTILSIIFSPFPCWVDPVLLDLVMGMHILYVFNSF